MIYNNSNIKTVWLDLDDTIIDFKTNARNALAQMYASEPILQQHFASANQWIDLYEHHNHQLWDAYSQAAISREHLRMERFRLPLTEAGIDDCTARNLSSRYDTLYLDLLADGHILMPGAITLLEALRADSSIGIAILSNGFRDVQHRKIENCNLKPYFDHIVLSDDIGVNKPNLQLFWHAMQIAGSSNPSEHLMIGDNPSTDIAGAINAGWHAILYAPRLEPSSIPTFQSPVQVATDLTLLAKNLTHSNR